MPQTLKTLKPQQASLWEYSTDYSQTSTVNSTRVCHFYPILYLEFLMLNHNPQVHLSSLLCQEVWLYTGRLIPENPKTWESQTSFCDDEDIKESSCSSKSDKEYIWWLTWCWVLWRRVGHHGYNILCHTASLTHSLLLLICNKSWNTIMRHFFSLSPILQRKKTSLFL